MVWRPSAQSWRGPPCTPQAPLEGTPPDCHRQTPASPSRSSLRTHRAGSSATVAPSRIVTATPAHEASLAASPPFDAASHGRTSNIVGDHSEAPPRQRTPRSPARRHSGGGPDPPVEAAQSRPAVPQAPAGLAPSPSSHHSTPASAGLGPGHLAAPPVATTAARGSGIVDGRSSPLASGRSASPLHHHGVSAASASPSTCRRRLRTGVHCTPWSHYPRLARGIAPFLEVRIVRSLFRRRLSPVRA